jgi:DNA (cytosine-5)-methyltransferase 1
MIALAKPTVENLPRSLAPHELGSWIKRKTWPKAPGKPERTITVADLFAGCGGLTLGAAEAARRHDLGFEIRLAVDFDTRCTAVYGRNFKVPVNRLVCGSITDLVPGELGAAPTATERLLKKHVGRLDLVLAGPPCQGHSDLNNHSRRDDPKNLLYLRAIRFIEVIQPMAAIIENVPAARHDKNQVVQTAAKFLETLGYHVAYSTISACKFALPQRRRRLVLIASKRHDPKVLFEKYSAPQKVYPLRKLIGDLQDAPDSAGAEDIFSTPSAMQADNRQRVEYLFRYGRYDLPNSQRPACHRDKEHTYKSMYGRLRWNRPAQTITGGFGSMGQGRYVHPSRKRVITPHEAARIQGFPDYFDFRDADQRTTLHQMIGNAVPPVMAFRPVYDMLAGGYLGA